MLTESPGVMAPNQNAVTKQMSTEANPKRQAAGALTIHL
jgi:hypothetical protein